jgi:hypothetical protein
MGYKLEPAMTTGELPERHGGTEPEEKVGCWIGSVFAALATSPTLSTCAPSYDSERS